MREAYFGGGVFLAALSLQLLHPQGWVGAVALGIVAMIVVRQYPIIKEKARVGALEKELPGALRLAASRMEMGISYETAVLSLAKGDGALAKEFGRVRKDSGTMPVPEALVAMASRVKSKWVRRACLLLVDCYEKGSSPEHVQKLAEEIDQRQLELAREYSGVLATVSIAFIGVSALFPALFQAYVIVGSRFLSTTVTPFEALAVPAIVFPLLDVMVVAIAKWRRPWSL